MKNIYFVLTMVILLFITIICKNIKEEFVIQNSSNTINTDLNYLHENNVDKPLFIVASKNVTNDRKDDAYVTYDLSHTVNPKYRFHPENINQVSFILKSKKFGTNIRVSGNHNTFNDISITKDTIIRTDKFNKILNINKSKKQATVESGVLLETLHNELLKNYMSLPILPESMTHSVGGAISTGVHGSCVNEGTLSSYIVDITMVLPSGKIQTFTKKDKEFKALTVGLGCLGFIYSVTLQCIEPFTVRHEEILSNWEDIQMNIQSYLDSNSLLQIYITDPYNEKLPCVLFLRKKIDMKSGEKQEYSEDYNRNLKIGESHKILGKDIRGSYTEQEIGVSPKYLNSSIQDIILHMKNYKHEFELTTKFPIIIRFSGKDKNSYLSTTSKKNITAWISIYNDVEDVKKDCLDKMSKEIEDQLILQYKGRPNYSKRNFLDQEKMSLLYGHCYRDFQHVHNLLDPERLFTNDYIKRVIGD